MSASRSSPYRLSPTIICGWSTTRTAAKPPWSIRATRRRCWRKQTGAAGRITKILNTHWHPDHTDGNLGDQGSDRRGNLGAGGERMGVCLVLDHPLTEGDRISIGAHSSGSLPWKCRATTIGHRTLTFFAEDEVALCGDTLFAMGCGRLFEGSPADASFAGAAGGTARTKPGSIALTNIRLAQCLLRRPHLSRKTRKSRSGSVMWRRNGRKHARPFPPPLRWSERPILSLLAGDVEEFAELRREKDSLLGRSALFVRYDVSIPRSDEMAQRLHSAIVLTAAAATASCMAGRHMSGRLVSEPGPSLPSARRPRSGPAATLPQQVRFARHAGHRRWYDPVSPGRHRLSPAARRGCPGIASGATTLVTRPLGSRDLCAGDINYTVDLQSGHSGRRLRLRSVRPLYPALNLSRVERA